MDNIRLQELLQRLRNHALNDNEMEELNDWYHQLTGGRTDFEAWVKEEGGEQGLRTHLYKNFNRKLEKSTRINRQKMLWYRVAAILVIAFTGGILLLRANKQAAVHKNVVAMAAKKAPIMPGTNKATLILANGSSIALGDATDSTMAQAGVNIKKVGKGKLVYSTTGAANTPAAIAYNTVITPRAGQYQLVLQDGTKVWLNADSRLRYPVQFSGNERRVELEGEAYFEVVHNDAMPFKVVTGEVITTDLGTHFNIKAYNDDDKIATTLLQGSVNVNDQLTGQTKLLIPGKQARITKGNGVINIANAPIEEVVAWKNGYFIFDNEDIRSVMKLISRWYDVDVTYHLSKNVHVGGTFSKAENLDHLLKSFELIGNIHCDLKERRIIVSN
jgi:ferric-dicitrate binding protein FerR (iron transport regulator)